MLSLCLVAAVILLLSGCGGSSSSSSFVTQPGGGTFVLAGTASSPQLEVTYPSGSSSATLSATVIPDPNGQINESPAAGPAEGLTLVSVTSSSNPNFIYKLTPTNTIITNNALDPAKILIVVKTPNATATYVIGTWTGTEWTPLPTVAVPPAGPSGTTTVAADLTLSGSPSEIDSTGEYALFEVTGLNYQGGNGGPNGPPSNL